MASRKSLIINDLISIPRAELKFTFVRSSGPGGQNVNKVNSKAVLRWAVATSPSLPMAVRNRFLGRYARRINDEGELVLASQRYRDQGRNLDDCLHKLQQLIVAVATPPKPRKKTKPPRRVNENRISDKLATSAKKQRRRPPSGDGD